MSNINNKISLLQWNELMEAVRTNFAVSKQPEGAVYAGKDKINNNEVNSSRYFCYDNYDRYDVPGLDFIIKGGEDMGTLTVYNGSEQARAPITFDQGLKILFSKPRTYLIVYRIIF